MSKTLARKILILLVLLITGQSLVAQENKQGLKFSGTILDGETADPLAGVHILSLGHTGTVTDLDGNFTLQVSKGDTVRISHVGYNVYLVPIPDRINDELNLTIGLTPSLTELDNIFIYQWPATLSQFKQKVLATEIEVEEKVVIPGSYEGPPKPVEPGVGSPISFLQSKLSKKVKRRQEFLKKRLELTKNKTRLHRYSPEYVAEITGIEDELELDEFMAYCKLTDAYIARVSEYDLIITINQCYREFRSERLD